MRFRLPGRDHLARHLPGHHAHADGADAFHESAARYDWMARYLMRPMYRRIAADVVAASPHGASVLDVGTGPGRLLVEIARARPDLRVTGLDLAPGMVEAARGNLTGFGERANAVVGDVNDLPFQDDAFDLIVSTLSVHHWADPAGGGAQLARVLRPGGQIRIYDVRSAPFAALHAAVTGRAEPVKPSRLRITPLPVPALRRLVI